MSLEAARANQAGLAAYQQGRLDEAGRLFAQAEALDGKVASYPYHLGLVLQALGHLDPALDAFRRAVAIDPKHAKAHNNVGMALHVQGRAPEAVEAYARAAALDPRLAAAHNNLGLLLTERGALADAVAALRRTLALVPQDSRVHSNLGNALLALGQRDEAMAAYDKAVALEPMSPAASNRLLALHYRSDVTPGELRAEHDRWGARYARPPQPAFANERDPDRRLRIGFVSPDFRDHPVPFFLEPLLRARDPSAMEVFCYAEVAAPDAVTARLQGLCDHWRSTVGLSDQGLAEAVRADRIDVLIDLAGHTNRGRITAFALGCAPVQATWLGYPDTTGLPAMDYRIVDPVTDPPGIAEAWSSEALVRLEGGFLCYGPPAGAPVVEPPPSLAGAAPTFGSFNNPAKLSEATLDAWAALLKAVPAACLVLKASSFTDAEARRLMTERFTGRGIDPARLDLRSYLDDGAEHLAAYGAVDVALDPFPYNGTTTTCEALWMGVPVVTLSGDRHAGRVGVSLLSRVGLAALIADTPDRYVEIAASLIADTARLADLRQSLRERLRASPLCVAPAFAHAFETGLRRMWRRWCDGEAPAALSISSENGLSLEPMTPAKPRNA